MVKKQVDYMQIYVPWERWESVKRGCMLFDPFIKQKETQIRKKSSAVRNKGKYGEWE